MRTRQKLADLASAGGVVRTIREVFDAEGFNIPDSAGEPPPSGVRRWYVSQYLATADWNDKPTQRAFARVVAVAIEEWGQDTFSGRLEPAARSLIQSARRDGLPLTESGELTLVEPGRSLPLDRYEPLTEPAAAQEAMSRIERNLDDDPSVAIGASKDLVETICKHILDDYGEPYARNENMLDLYNMAAKVLQIHRSSVPDNAKASATAKRILQNVATAVQGLSELRNEIGSGHGKTFRSAAQPRHARLALNATRTVVEFLLETWTERRRQQRAAEVNTSEPG